MTLSGADAEALRSVGDRFADGSWTLRAHRAALDIAFATTAWRGSDADRCRAEWQQVLAPTLAAAVVFLQRLSIELCRHADEQRAAAAGRIDGRHRERFEPPADGRAAVVAALDALADGERIGADEIEIRALDNGRYVVVLPGVTDLSHGARELVDGPWWNAAVGIVTGVRDALAVWSDDEPATPRRTVHAVPAVVGLGSSNPYAAAVVAALERAGVPAGAGLMIVGHSLGAYTALDPAAPPALNRAAGAAVEDRRGYHVDVTHVVTAGAEVDWRFGDLPASTDVLALNNRWDVLYQAEDLVHRDRATVHDGQLEKVFWGGRDGWGHGQRNYSEWVEQATDHADLASWLGRAGALYGTGGERVSADIRPPGDG